MLLSIFALTAIAARAMVTDTEVLKISKQLKPISDQEWGQIAGPQTSNQYEISSGDTLYDISKKLFGDPRYWPKIWALNNSQIRNPHSIKPGVKIAFMSGTGTSVPEVKIETTQTDAPSPMALEYQDLYDSKPRSNEWKKLSPQDWEAVQLNIPENIDQFGFEKKHRYGLKKEYTIQLSAFAATHEIESLGNIQHSTAEARFLMTGDQVFIDPENKDSIKIDTDYSVVRESRTLSTRESGRKGYGYYVLGSVHITDVKENLVIGQILTAQLPIKRDDQLIPFFQKTADPEIIPAPEAKDGEIIIDRSFSSAETAQHKWVFIDLGSKDGVQPGMIARAYAYKDPITKKRITSDDLVKSGDVKIIQVSEEFSAALVLNSAGTLPKANRVVLLTDVSEYFKGSKPPLPKKIELEPSPTPMPSIAPSPAPSPEPSVEALPPPLPEPSASAEPAPPLPPAEEKPAEEKKEDLLPPAPPPEEKLPETAPPLPKSEPLKPEATDTKPDELDQIEGDDKLTPDEKKELRQLEKWKNNPEIDLPPAPPAAAPPAEIPNTPPSGDDGIPLPPQNKSFFE